MWVSWKKDLATLALFSVAFLSCWGAYILYRAHQADIVLYLDDVVREIAFPFRLIELRLEEPLDELPMPVYGAVMEDVIDSWGYARTEGRTHEGTDIFADQGTPVFSVSDGYVTNTYFGHRGGNNVMVMGPGGVYYYYAHFERLAGGVERGMKVTPDTILGYVGISGNATGTPPHLHFGIYVRPWDAINPFPFLVDRWEASGT